jgi:mycofactocin precursor
VDTTCDDALAEVPDPERPDEPEILDEIEVEDLSVDGICGVY